MSETIIIVLQGGLGNQLFQYCAGLAMASRLGGQLWLTPTQENKHSARDYRQTLYTRAKALSPETPRAPLSQQAGAYDPWDPIQYEGHTAIALKGYYQFLHPIELHISKIRTDLDKALAHIRNDLQQKYQIKPAETCFLHVRRGDYLTQPPNTLCIQDESYYLPALQKIKLRQGRRRWLVLSDDIAWCRQQRWLTQPPFEIVDEPDELAGLMLMRLCEGGAIISNSTYSWWGAMLGCSSAPVVYPSKWFTNKKPNLFPSEWLQA